MTTPDHGFKVQETNILAKHRQKRSFPVDEFDWNRIKNKVSALSQARRGYSIGYSICLGVFATDVFTIISLTTSTTNIKNWIWIASWSVLVSSLVLSIALFLLDRLQDNVTIVSRNDILTEMSIVEQKFEAPDLSVQDK